MRIAAVVLAGMVLTACTARGPAPVSERGARPPSSVAVKPVTPLIEPSTNGLHTVQRGDTLYAIAFANSLDYREIASWNRLESPDRIMAGQVLRLSPPPGAVEIQPLEKPPEPSPRPLVDPPVLGAPQAVLLAYSDAGWAQMSGASALAAVAPAAKPEPVVPQPAITPTAPAATSGATSATATDGWLWPAEGTLIGRFGAAGGKGIDIVGARNAPVKAVAPGKVVYSGSGLRGYGHLLIVKHAGEFLSAYAHNDSVLVKEGDAVKAGQRIASMGDSGADRVKLHFEIRRYGKPLDPLDYLPERS